jgi:hypothetical protein
MSYLWADGFDLYAGITDAQPFYDSLTGSLVSSFMPVGNGSCLDTSSLSKTWGTQEGTLYFSFFGIMGNATSSNIALVFADGGSAQCSIICAGDSSITARSGGITGTVLGSVPNVLRGSSTPGVWGPWFSLQTKVVISTSGSIEVRLNGSSTPVLLLMNVNTRAGSSNNYATKFTLGGTSWTRFTYLWLNNGDVTAPTGWPGEPRPIRQGFASDFLAQFTPVPSAAHNYLRINEAIYDGDAGYVQSNVVGKEDFYNLASISNLQQILGVQFATWAKKSDAGERVGSIQLMANGSSDTTLLSFTPSDSYDLYQVFAATDPTNAAWTTTSLSGAQLGIRVVS